MDASSFIGKTLEGRYNVKGSIGKGGSARVFYAEDTLLHRTVALKILENDKNELCLNTKSFDTEAKAISMLSHPNIVNVYDISMSGSVKYIVMEYVEGITLRAYLDHRKILPPSEVVSCARQVLRGLREAHNKGIVHRDIKPQNIMIMKNGQIKVADFGIARLPDRDRFLMPDRSIGTVHYISPEQARGGAVDPRSDIYSLGIVMYEMATGVRPFEAEQPSDVAIMQVTDTPVRPCEVNPDLPRELENVIMCALSKKPENRYESAQDMLRVLERMTTFTKREAPEQKTAQNPILRLRQLMTKQTPEDGQSYEQQPAATETPTEEATSESAVVSEETDTMEIPFATDSGIEAEFERAEAVSDFDEVDYDYEELDISALEDEDTQRDEDEDETEDEEKSVFFLIEKKTSAQTDIVNESENDLSKDTADKMEEGSEDDEPTRLIDAFDEEKTKTVAPVNNGYFYDDDEDEEEPQTLAERIAAIPAETKRLVAIIAGASVALVAIIVAAILIIPALTQKYVVPSYEGQHYITIDDASIFKFVTEQKPSNLPEGTVIDQMPDAGEKLREGDTVKLVISEGPKVIPLVLDEGYLLSDVLTQLKAAFDAYEITVTVNVKYEYSTALAEGVIFSYSGEVRDGGVLTLRVSAGANKQYVQMPDFVGKRLSDAVKFLEDNSVAYEIAFSETDKESGVGIVVEQSVAVGASTEKYVESGRVILTVGALS